MMILLLLLLYYISMALSLQFFRWYRGLNVLASMVAKHGICFTSFGPLPDFFFFFNLGHCFFMFFYVKKIETLIF